MDETKKLPDAVLNPYDRKILKKYTKVPTNMIESNTASTETGDDNRNTPVKQI